MGIKMISPPLSVERLERNGGKAGFCADNGSGKPDATGFHRLKYVPTENSAEHVMTDYAGKRNVREKLTSNSAESRGMPKAAWTRRNTDGTTVIIWPLGSGYRTLCAIEETEI